MCMFIKLYLLGTRKRQGQFNDDLKADNGNEKNGHICVTDV